MPIRLTDAEIRALVEEEKCLPGDFRKRLVVRQKHGHKERDLTVKGASGRTFRIILRESDFNPMAFSAILAYIPDESNIPFRLRRYNGKSHEHTNKLEKQRFYDFHIHMATERYQTFGEEKEDAYAEVSRNFADLQTALNCLLADCGFVTNSDEVIDLFAEGKTHD